MSDEVTLTIDGEKVSVPAGTFVVDAAKKAGVYIPVFCYHPKLEPVGMCRMCLVEIGRPVRDRQTGEFERDDQGNPVIQFFPKLETACTVPVSEGMVVRGFTEKVNRARKDILEFLLTSHPLDCPICDKGGECPLQNLTLDFGPVKSRFLYDEKMKLAKRYPLGDLILLDRERCIQCGRCVRFQDEIVDDPVIGFAQRGRSLQIVTYSEPGFDSYFSGNTTDICPVGALTTRDFRFGARPWEMDHAASICPHCPVGCNLTLDVRRESKSGGNLVVKRVMPRQNEWVNELWICDKGRFAYHFAESQERLSQPLVRVDGELVPASWEEALDAAARGLQAAGSRTLALAGGCLSNEDLFNLKELAARLDGKAALYAHMAGGDLTAQIGVGSGTNFRDMGAETAILVVASDLEEEAPIYWLRVKQAADRGAKLIVANPRATKLDRYASHTFHYPYGSEAAVVVAMLNVLSTKRPELPDAVQKLARSTQVQSAVKTFAEAENAVILFGSEGMNLASSKALAEACANLLIATDHVGKPNNGLIGVWPQANTQGGWDMGFRPAEDLSESIRSAQSVYVVGADPVEDDPHLAEVLESVDFLIVQDIFLTETARLAHVVLPAQAFTEREGTYTNGEGRVQRFYPAVPPRHDTRPDFAITGEIGARIDLDLETSQAWRIMERIAESVPGYAGLNYQKLAEVVEQWPLIGREDLYYGGTAYENQQGIGVQRLTASELGETTSLKWPSLVEPIGPDEDKLVAVPVTRLYDRGRMITTSEVLQPRVPDPFIICHPKDLEKFDLSLDEQVLINLNGMAHEIKAFSDETLPQGFVLVPRSMGLPVGGPVEVKIRRVERIAV